MGRLGRDHRCSQTSGSHIPGQGARSGDASDSAGPQISFKVLEGQDTELKDENAYKLFRKIISKWITELDLGRRSELRSSRSTRSRWTNCLRFCRRTATSRMSGSGIRQPLFSTVEVETRLTSSKLADEIGNASARNIRSTSRRRGTYATFPDETPKICHRKRDLFAGRPYSI